MKTKQELQQKTKEKCRFFSYDDHKPIEEHGCANCGQLLKDHK